MAFMTSLLSIVPFWLASYRAIRGSAAQLTMPSLCLMPSSHARNA